MKHDHPGSLFKHGMADIEQGLRLHFVAAGNGTRTIVLLHGFPQTWWAWHQVIPPLVEAGFRVIAPDYRGAGQLRRSIPLLSAPRILLVVIGRRSASASALSFSWSGKRNFVG